MISEVQIQWPPKRTLFGVEVSVTRYDEVVDRIAEAAQSGSGGVATFLAVHGIVTAATKEDYRQRVNSCQIVGADGQPVRWAMNFFNKSHMEDRVYGPKAMLLVCKRCAELGLSIFLCGSTPQVLALLATNLTNEFPGLKIAGVESPPFRALGPQENDEICAKINRSGAAVAFIALGVPRQEIFAVKNRDKIHAIQLCVGAAFDFHSGCKKMAPDFMQRWGLEWLYRLTQEPRRLWKRYLFTNTVFIGLFVLNAFRQIGRRRVVPQETQELGA
jgi:exopolysaccharide biosynthesis WecB/TagA/CpsF family protein